MNEKGIINHGDPNCRHYMVISAPRIGHDEIGECKYCHRKVNYTVMQKATFNRYQRCAMDKPDDLTNGSTLEKIVKVRTGNTVAMKERRQRRTQSAGRVA